MDILYLSCTWIRRKSQKLGKFSGFYRKGENTNAKSDEDQKADLLRYGFMHFIQQLCSNAAASWPHSACVCYGGI